MIVTARLTLVVGLIGVSIAGSAQAQTIDDARNLYAGAAYAEALEVLNAVEKTSPTLTAMRETLQYRALCLLALSRRGDAEQTVARLVSKDPTYLPDAVEAPPQLRELFRQVREQQLPALVRQKFTAARESFARERSAETAALFDSVLALLDTPEVQSALGTEAVADLRTVATGFRDLAKVPAVTGAVATVNESRPPRDGGIALAPNAVPAPVAAPPASADATIFDADNSDVVAPVTVRQEFPPLLGTVERSLGAGSAGSPDRCKRQGRVRRHAQSHSSNLRPAAGQ